MEIILYGYLFCLKMGDIKFDFKFLFTFLLAQAQAKPKYVFE